MTNGLQIGLGGGAQKLHLPRDFWCFVFVDIFLNSAAGRPLQLSRRSTTEHY
jgi:hypothetical protein